MTSSAGSGNATKDSAYRVLVVVAIGIYMYIGLGSLALNIYDSWLPGVPDAGRVPLSVLPSLLFFFLPYLDPFIFVAWLVACSTFLIPPAFMACFGRGLQALLLSSVVVLLANAYGAWEIWSSRMIYFHARPYSVEAGLANLARDTSFILLFSVLGLLVGYLTRKLLTAKGILPQREGDAPQE